MKNYFEEIFDLKDKVAVIAGGNGQLGTQYAKALLKVGARVAIFDRNSEPNDGFKEITAEEKKSLHLFAVDITKKIEVVQALDEVERLWGTPSILINNAAVDSPPGSFPEENESFESYSLESWEKVIGVNLTGMFICCQVIGARMAEKKYGNIINISSTYGIVSPNQNIYKYRAENGKPFVKPIAYSVSKSGVLNMTRYLATYWADKGVRVNTLTPGGVYNNQDETFVKNYSALTPLGRMARKDEYNGAILFLASDASSYMTGANLVVDGGWTAW